MGGLAFNEQTILAAAGILASALFFYVPQLKAWLDSHERRFKVGLMALLSVVAGLGLWALSCTPVGAEYGMACPEQTSAIALILKVAFNALIAFGSNQAAYHVLKREPAG